MELELDLEELKAEADSLGMTYSPNIGATRLKAKIDEFYSAQETSNKVVLEAVKQNEKQPSVSKKSTKGEKIAEAKRLANVLKIVTVIDNDNRVNNQSTSGKVNCSNMYFDLGQITFPLNTPIEMRQGHIDSLKEIKIPMHVKDPHTNLSTPVLRNRYSVV